MGSCLSRPDLGGPPAGSTKALHALEQTAPAHGGLTKDSSASGPSSRPHILGPQQTGVNNASGLQKADGLSQAATHSLIREAHDLPQNADSGITPALGRLSQPALLPSREQEPRRAMTTHCTPDVGQGTDTPLSILTQSFQQSPMDTSNTLKAWGSANMASAFSELLTTAGDRHCSMTVAELGQEIHDLAFIGQGAGGDVYRGRWEGALVAIKYIVCPSSDAQQAATNEAALGRLLAHPNVVQTFSCKTAVIDEAFSQQLQAGLEHPPHQECHTEGVQGFDGVEAALRAERSSFGLAPDRSNEGERGRTADAALEQQQQQRVSPDRRGPAGGEGAVGGAETWSGLYRLAESLGPAGTAETPGQSASASEAGPQQQCTGPQGPRLVASSSGTHASPRVQSVGTTVLGMQLQGHRTAAVAPAEEGEVVDQEIFHSGEGFGNPLGQPHSLLAIQEVLLRADARIGYQLTQIIMEHCDKGSLLHAIERGLFLPASKWGARLALRALLRTAQEVAQGMWHIHQCNVIHGDLKPGNVLLKSSRADRRGFVAKVADFGLSRISDRTTKDSKHWGTVYYMAPETFDGILAKQSDVYSFGITLWQMVTGEKPWEQLHPGQIIVGVQSGQLTLEWPSHVPARLVKLGQACLEHDRKARPLFNYIVKELSQIENLVRLDGNGASACPTPPLNGPASEHSTLSRLAPGTRRTSTQLPPSSSPLAPIAHVLAQQTQLQGQPSALTQTSSQAQRLSVGGYPSSGQDPLPGRSQSLIVVQGGALAESQTQGLHDMHTPGQTLVSHPHRSAAQAVPVVQASLQQESTSVSHNQVQQQGDVLAMNESSQMQQGQLGRSTTTGSGRRSMMTIVSTSSSSLNAIVSIGSNVASRAQAGLGPISSEASDASKKQPSLTSAEVTLLEKAGRADRAVPAPSQLALVANAAQHMHETEGNGKALGSKVESVAVGEAEVAAAAAAAARLSGSASSLTAIDMLPEVECAARVAWGVRGPGSDQSVEPAGSRGTSRQGSSRHANSGQGSLAARSSSAADSQAGNNSDTVVTSPSSR